MTWVLRRFHAGDVAACGAVYFDAVRNGTAPHYTAEQAAAWAPSPAPEGWADLLAESDTWIVEAPGFCAGFLTLRADGHLEFFFVRPTWRGAGVSHALYRAALAHAKLRGHRKLTTHASLLARRFLERRGWQVTEEEEVERHGARLRRFAMALDPLHW